MTTIDLGYRPRAWQATCHRSKRRFNVLALHRRAGKTELALRELIEGALRCPLELGLFVYVAPFLNQARSIAWAKLKRFLEPLRRAGLVDVHEVSASVVFRSNGATIRIFGADNADALRGLRLDGAVLDEVAQIKPEVWHDVIRPALADRKGWATFIGTPNGINLFSTLFDLATNDPEWYAARWTVYETQALDMAEVESIRREAPPSSFAREFLCDFGASGDDQLLSLTDVLEATKRQYRDVDIQHAPRILGIDPARFGNDRSVIVRRQGLVMLPPTILAGIDNMALADRVAWTIQDWKPDAVFCDAGAGSGVIDRLRQLGHAVVEVPFGGKANLPHLFSNRRTEMWCEMAEWVVSGGSIPAEPTAIRTELATPTYKFDSAGRKVLESKDDIRKRLPLSGSPDIADALALTFAAPVVPKVERRPAAKSHDPYAAFRR